MLQYNERAQSTTSTVAAQVRPSVFNTPANSKGGHKYVASLHKFSALVVHSCAEAAAILGH